jgi:hypothetical protein
MIASAGLFARRVSVAFHGRGLAAATSAGQLLDRLVEGPVIEEHQQADNVAAALTAATIENLFGRVDREAVGAAAFGARAGKLNAPA